MNSSEGGTVDGPPRRTFIVETNEHGHRLFYVRLLVEAALQRGDEVYLGTRADVLSTPEGREHLSELRGWHIVPMTTKRLGAVQRASVNIGATTTVIPDGDRIAIELGRWPFWKGSGRMSVLIMRETVQPGKSAVVTRLKQWLRSLLIHRAKRVRGVQLAVLKSAGWKGRSDLVAAVDPIVLSASKTDAVSFRSANGMGGDRVWFAVLGALSLRKNIPLVCESLAAVRGRPAGLLLAGALDDDAREQVEGAIERLRSQGIGIVVKDRLLSDQELDSAVIAADCLVLAHSNEGPSGLLGKALAAGTKVVAAGAQSLREDARRYPALVQWSPLQRESITGALAQAIESGPGRPVLAPGSDEFTGALL